MADGTLRKHLDSGGISGFLLCFLYEGWSKIISEAILSCFARCLPSSAFPRFARHPPALKCVRSIDMLKLGYCRAKLVVAKVFMCLLFWCFSLGFTFSDSVWIELSLQAFGYSISTL